MKLLVLASDYPATTSTPGSPRLFNLCRSFPEEDELHLVLLRETALRRDAFLSDPDHSGVFASVTVLSEQKPTEIDTVPLTSRILHSLMQRPFFATAIKYPNYHQSMIRGIEDCITKLEPDVLYVDGHQSAQYVTGHVDVPVVVDFCDSLELLYRRQVACQNGINEKIRYWLESHSLGRYEASIATQVHLSVFISEADAAVVRKRSSRMKSVVICNGIDTEYFMPEKHSSDLTKRFRCIFTGVMNYPPNEDAVCHFVEEVLPYLQKHIEHLEFWIVGASPTQRVLELEKQKGVRVTGRVDDLREYMAQCDVFVSPLRFGAGVKNKVLAAMAMKLPLIATKLSCEGIRVETGVHFISADDREEFLVAMRRFLDDPSLCGQLGGAGRTLVCNDYSWQRYAGLLRETIEESI